MTQTSNVVTAVYPGTFDPITLGHETLVRRAAKLFGRVIIAVAAGHHKKPMFTLDERMAMARQSFADLPGVSVESYDGLVRDFVVARGAQVMVRGVRGPTDFDYEVQLAGMNRNLMPDVETIFLTPTVAYQFVSSSFMREIATLGGDVAPYVAPHVHAALMAKVGRHG